MPTQFVNFLCLLHSEERQSYDVAERMYKNVLLFTPNHTNTLYNYAVLLDTHLKRKDEAEGYYRKTLDLEPKHAYALYNLAVLIEEKLFQSNIVPGTVYAFILCH
jgi:tetratricopeptide (TPR) repeat protein